MAELWFWLLASMLAIYMVLDGGDFGVGLLHFVVGRNEAERTVLLRTIGPIWDGNEVWLIAAGGTLFAAFPLLYAVTFSGFYLPLMISLWLLLFRALGIELRHQLHDPMWLAFWDVAFSAASALLAIVFGAALGNLVRGVPLDQNFEFFEPLWTDFRVGARTGVLDWYTVLVALGALLALTLHGALWLVMKTERELRARAVSVARAVFAPALLASAFIAVATFEVQPQMRVNLERYPLGYVFPLLGVLALVFARVALSRKQARAAFLGSSFSIFAQILAAAFAVFPNALSAREPLNHMTLRVAAADEHTLRSMLIWWVPGMLIASAYSYFSYARLPATFRLEEEEE